MSKKREAIDFMEMVRQMKEDDKLSAEDWPTIRGDECAAGDLLEWLKKLDLSGMKFRIWEFTDRCTIGTDAPPQQVERLERARLFGESGDLDIRRDGQRFLWRYVGAAENAPACEEMEWPGSDVNPVYRRERTALLWGTRERQQTQWFDDRVSGASLTYFPNPTPLDEGVEERVQVQFREYTQAGRVLAVWLRGLEVCNG